MKSEEYEEEHPYLKRFMKKMKPGEVFIGNIRANKHAGESIREILSQKKAGGVLDPEQTRFIKGGYFEEGPEEGSLAIVGQPRQSQHAERSIRERGLIRKQVTR